MTRLPVARDAPDQARELELNRVNADILGLQRELARLPAASKAQGGTAIEAATRAGR